MNIPHAASSDNDPSSCISDDSCAPSAQGCLRCQSVKACPIPANTSAILLGCRDADASATLQQALMGSDFDCQPFGPLLVIREIRDRLKELGALLNNRLSIYTQSCIQAAYSPGAINTMDQALHCISFAAPLVDVIRNIEHEWIRTALNQNWLFSVFHPIVDAATGDIYAYEALLRARNPHDNAILSAGQVITACEELNLLHVLDQRARQCAIRTASEYLPTHSRVFINFLPSTIYDPEICLRTTMQAAKTYGVAMERLVFEVVETEKIPDMDHLFKVLNYYRQRGVGTAIDDMGAGFTSENYITALKPEFVKLDRELVLAAEKTPASRQAMDHLIHVSHSNGAKIIAEGIETVSQLRMCRESGVDLLQGFLFARPACPPQRVTFPGTQKQAA